MVERFGREGFEGVERAGWDLGGFDVVWEGGEREEILDGMEDLRVDLWLEHIHIYG